MAGTDGTAALPTAARRAGSLERQRHGPLAPYLLAGPVLDVGPGTWAAPAEPHAVVYSAYQLQDVADHRAALQAWFGAVREGGFLVLVVPHAFLHERQLELPTPLNPGQRRLYTPGMLMEQVEEALEPNSYRLRLLQDDDAGYDYAAPSPPEPQDHADILAVLERIAPPAWSLDVAYKTLAPVPDYAFEPSRTRVEVAVARSVRRVLVTKLDHLGDFIMGLGALEKVRALFRDAEITLVVGSWNAQMARDMGLADHVIPFDAFPRNSSEEEVDVPGRTAIFRQAVTGEYDIAIDLRSDFDTRFLLRSVRAPLKAGLGTRARFPYLDIFLPVESTRNEPETAREIRLNNHDFASQAHVTRADHRSVVAGAEAERGSAIIWGPYLALRPGRYLFEPWLELEDEQGTLLLDVALDARRVAHTLVPPFHRTRLPFTVDVPNARFEFRVWTAADLPAPDFSFFGGRLIREGAASVLHQSEYLSLLVELVALRLGRTGLLTEPPR